MPNWCNNDIAISGPRDAVRKLWEDAQQNGLLASLMPEPDYESTPVPEAFPEITAESAETEAEREAALKNEPTIRKDSWWDWRVTHWGTKWEVELGGLDYSEDGDTGLIMGEFLSAWSPPVGATSSFSERNPDISIELYYYAPGMGCAGKCIDGVDQEYTLDDVPPDIDEIFGINEDLEL